MNKRQIAGVICILAGAFLLIFSRYNLNRIERMQMEVKEASWMMKGNDNVVTQEAVDELKKYQNPLEVVFYASFFLLLGGAAVYVGFQRKSRR